MKRLGLLATMALMVVTSCNKDDEGNGSTYLRSARDMASVENRSIKMLPMAFYMAKQLSLPDSMWFACGTMTVLSGDTSTWPTGSDSLTIRLDNGTGCAAPDQSVWAGIMDITYIGHPDSAGSTISLSFSNFQLDGYTFDGSMDFTATMDWGAYDLTANDGTWSLGNDSIHVNLTGNMIIVDTSTSMDDWTTHRWEGNFSGSGVDIEQRAFDLSAYLSLGYSIDCKWIKYGISDIKPDEYSWRSLEFGDGQCDGKATLVVGSSLYTFDIN